MLKPAYFKKTTNKKKTLLLEAHECRKHCKTQEKKQNTVARRISSTEMCAKTMRLASNVYHMNAKNRQNVGSVSHPAGSLTPSGLKYILGPLFPCHAYVSRKYNAEKAPRLRFSSVERLRPASARCCCRSSDLARRCCAELAAILEALQWWQTMTICLCVRPK